MTRILAPEPPGAVETLAAVLERAVGESAPPSALVLEDPAGSWLRELAAMGEAQRSAAVAVVRSEGGAAAAAALGVGGAAWWPVGTPALAAAAEAAAAASAPAPETVLPAAAGEVLLEASDGELLEVAHRRRPFWRHQLGERRLRWELAEALRGVGREPVLVEGPSALVEGEVARRLLGRPAGSSTGGGSVETEGLAVAGPEPRDGDPGAPMAPRAVYTLPTGRRVGAWCAGPGGGSTGEGWVAVPADPGGLGRTWRLGEGEDTVPEVLTGVQARRAAAEGVPAVRVPGWLAAGLGPGKAAWLLVERLARSAAGAGVPLWVPNVEDRALRLLLTLHVTLWVDGPAVPGS